MREYIIDYYCHINTSDRQVWCFSDAAGLTYSHEKGLNVDTPGNTKDRCLLLQYYSHIIPLDTCIVYYESIKGGVKIRPVYQCRCDE